MKKLSKQTLCEINGGVGFCPDGFRPNGAFAVRVGQCILTIYGGICNSTDHVIVAHICIDENGNGILV